MVRLLSNLVFMSKYGYMVFSSSLSHFLLKLNEMFYTEFMRPLTTSNAPSIGFEPV